MGSRTEAVTPVVTIGRKVATLIKLADTKGEGKLDYEQAKLITGVSRDTYEIIETLYALDDRSLFEQVLDGSILPKAAFDKAKIPLALNIELKKLEEKYGRFYHKAVGNE